jgi:signal transduction histidine kinase/cell division protein FtsL
MHFPGRRTSLFLIALLIPCAVLVALGLRTIEQDRQLENKRLIEERQRAADQIRQTLLSQLEKIKLAEVTRIASRSGATDAVGRDNAVAFVGPVLDGQLQLPWENNPSAQNFREGLNDGSFAERIRDAEAQELVAHRYESAARQYREAIGAAGEPAQQAYTRLLLARTLQNLVQRQESEAEYKRVLSSSPDLVDQHDVPLGLYAAGRLLEFGAKREELIERIRFAADGDRMLPPIALRMTRDIAIRLGAPDLVSRLDELIREREQAEALQRDLAHMMPAPQNREPVWASYGEPPLLTSLTPPVANFEGLVIAVRASEALKELSTPDRPIHLAAETDTAGKPLGESFPGLRVLMPEPQEQRSSLRQTFIVAALLLALAFTLLAGYLLRRDVRRDLRLAELRSQFVSSVTHELKTPLTAIRMFTETLRLDEEVDRATRLEYLDTILHESERLSRLVDNVLDFGKIERGKKTYRFQPVRLEEVIGEAARAAQYPLEQAGFALEIATEPDLPLVSADSDALQQAILNLLTNAMKYSGDSRHIDLRLDRENGNARIRVVDRGVGIAPEEQEHIFESFYRAPTAENQRIPGTGLGLTIVEHIAKAHGGGVEVASTPGSGSAFTIRLPL